MLYFNHKKGILLRNQPLTDKREIMTELSAYQELANHIGHGHSKYIAEIFSILASENEAQLLLAAKAPILAEDLAKVIELPVESTQELLDDLFYKGMIYKSKKPEGTKYYSVRNVIQFHDATIVVNDPPAKMLELWRKYDHEEWPQYMKDLSSFFQTPPTRVIPINNSLDVDMKVLDFDDINKALDGANSIAVTRCSCRVVHGECGQPLEVCIQVNKAAEYSLERGTGRKISREEALEIFDDCGKKGLVHVAMNTRSTGQVICNCCDDCCENWSGGKQFVSPSRFLAAVDSNSCSYCEACVESCTFDAISMVEASSTAVVDEEKCMGCGICKTVCPDEAIGMKLVMEEDHVPA